MMDDSERSVGDPVLDRAIQGDAAEGNGRFGELGERFDRRSPFWIGLVGGLGLVAAYVLWVAISSAEGVLLLMAVTADSSDADAAAEAIINAGCLAVRNGTCDAGRA